MTDFVFLVSPQKLVALALIALGMVVAVIALFLAAETALRALDWYASSLDDYHAEGGIDDSDRH